MYIYLRDSRILFYGNFNQKSNLKIMCVVLIVFPVILAQKI